MTSNPRKTKPKGSGGGSVRANLSISAHRTPSLYAEIMSYPEEQRTGRVGELAMYGLECLKRGEVQPVVAYHEPISDKPIPEFKPEPKPTFDLSLIAEDD